MGPDSEARCWGHGEKGGSLVEGKDCGLRVAKVETDCGSYRTSVERLEGGVVLWGLGRCSGLMGKTAR